MSGRLLESVHTRQKPIAFVRARQSHRYAGETMKMVGLFAATATTTGVFQVRMPLCSEIALNLYKEAIQPKLAARSFTIDGSTRQCRAFLFALQRAKERIAASSTPTRRAYNQQWYAENRECTLSRNRRWHKRIVPTFRRTPVRSLGNSNSVKFVS
jgi:hypothetical protein